MWEWIKEQVFILRVYMNPAWAASLCCDEVPERFSHHYDSYCACCIGNCDKERE